MPIERLPDWDKRLPRVTEKHMHLPGEWGVSDCLMTVGEAIEAVTGENPFADYRGRYKTETGAARLLKKNGCDTVEDALARFFEPVNRLSAKRGDAGTMDIGGQIRAGYVCEYGFAVKGEHGLVFAKLTEMRTGFRVG